MSLRPPGPSLGWSARHSWLVSSTLPATTDNPLAAPKRGPSRQGSGRRAPLGGASEVLVWSAAPADQVGGRGRAVELVPTAGAEADVEVVLGHVGHLLSVWAVGSGGGRGLPVQAEAGRDPVQDRGRVGESADEDGELAVGQDGLGIGVAIDLVSASTHFETEASSPSRLWDLLRARLWDRRRPH